jgi:hypothetical protein
MSSSTSRIDTLSVATGEYQPPAGATPRSYIPKSWATVAALLAPLLLAISGAIPAPWGALLAIGAYAAAALAGVAMPAPRLVETRPVVGKVAVPILGTAAPVVLSLSEGLEGWPRVAAQVGALLLFWAAGRAMPAPQQAAPRA